MSIVPCMPMQGLKLPYIQRPGLEPIRFYRPGLYHPVNIGDIFQSRYHVIHRLGYGGYATVWLVRDTLAERWAALKVLAADKSLSTSELLILHHLKEAQQKDPLGKEFIIEIFDDFRIEGPNGSHQCIVMELLGPNLASELKCVYGLNKFPLDVGKRIATQIAGGVAYLHAQGVVHGDLHIQNILLRIPMLDQWSEEDVKAHFGVPILRPIDRKDGHELTPDESRHLPRYQATSFEPEKLLQLCLKSTNNIQVKIIDFGEAFLWNEQSRQIKLGIPIFYAAPEILLRDLVSPATDTWALAILIHMILSGSRPIFGSYYEKTENEILASMALQLGKFPERWWSRWEKRSEYFDEAGTYVGDGLEISDKLLLRVAGLSPVKYEELEGLFSRMLHYEPEDRISAMGVSKFLSSWLLDASGHTNFSPIIASHSK